MKKIFLIGIFLFLTSNIFAQITHIEGQLPQDDNSSRTTGVMLFYADTTTTPWSFYPVFDSTGAIKSTAFNSSLGANDVVVLNQPQYHYPAAEILVDSSDVVVSSAYVKFNMASYKYAAIAVNLDDSTSATFYSSIYPAPDFFDETSGDWGDISTAVIGADSVAFGTNTNYYITDALFPNEWILIKYNKWGDTNSIKIGVKKGY